MAMDEPYAKMTHGNDFHVRKSSVIVEITAYTMDCKEMWEFLQVQKLT
jgi:hypothetical protein